MRKPMVLVAVAALGITACAGDDSPEADETPASGVETGDESPADDADDADDAEDAEDAEGDSTQSGTEVDANALFTAIADASLEAGSYEFESTTSAGGQEETIAGAVEFATDISEGNMRLMMDVLGTGTASTILIVDGQFYMEMTEEMDLPGDASWLTVDPESDDTFSQQMTDSFTEVVSATSLLAQFAEQPDLLSVTDAGAEAVDGVETTQYLVTVDDVSAFEALPEVDAKSAEVSFTMWVDRDDLPRRMTATVDGETVIDMTFTSYGHVDLEAPPADEVLVMNQ